MKRRARTAAAIAVSGLAGLLMGCGPLKWQEPCVIGPHVTVTLTRWEYVPRMGDSDTYSMEVLVQVASPDHPVEDLNVWSSIWDSSTVRRFERQAEGSTFLLVWGQNSATPCPLYPPPIPLRWVWYTYVGFGDFDHPFPHQGNGRAWTGRPPGCPCVPYGTGTVVVQLGGEYKVDGIPYTKTINYTMEIRA